MELFSYYNLSESANVDIILKKLESLSQDLKIDYIYQQSREIVKITDIDLTEKEILDLCSFFESNDVLPDLDIDDRDDYDDLYGFDSDDDGYDF